MAKRNIELQPKRGRYTKRQKIDNDDTVYEKFEYFTITCSISSFIKNDNIKKSINKYVEIMSRMTIAASLNIYYDIYDLLKNGKGHEHFKKKPVFSKYFYQLLEKTSSKMDSPINHSFKQMLNECQLMFDRVQFGNLIKYGETSYSTALANNIKMHAYKRVKKCLQNIVKIENIEKTKKASKKAVLSTIQYLFKKDFNEEDAHPILLKRFRDITDSNKRFTGYKQYWYMFIPIFYKIQIWNDNNNLKNFKLLPIFHHKRHHINIDKETLYFILRDAFADKFKEEFNAKNLTEKIVPEQLFKHFEFKKFEKVNKGKIFQQSFKTDGVSVKVFMSRRTGYTTKAEEDIKKSKTDEEKKAEKIEKRKRQMAEIKESLPQIEQIYGFDPGQKLSFGGIRVNPISQQFPSKIDYVPSKTDIIKYSNKKTQFDRKFKVMNEKQKNITNRIDIGYNLRARLFSQKDPHNFKQFIKFHLTFFKSKQCVYSSKKLARIAFMRFIHTQRFLTRFTKELVGGKQTLFIIGDGKLSAASPIKGHLRSPNEKVMAHLKRQPNVKVITIDESYTTKNCSKCFKATDKPSTKRSV